MNAAHHLPFSAPHLERLLTAFERINGSRILLTGGTGFVGKWMLQTAKIAQANSHSKIELVIPTRQLSAQHVQDAIAIGCPNVSWVEGDFLTNAPDVGNVDMIIQEGDVVYVAAEIAALSQFDAGLASTQNGKGH